MACLQRIVRSHLPHQRLVLPAAISAESGFYVNIFPFFANSASRIPIDQTPKIAQRMAMEDVESTRDLDIDDLGNRLFFRLYQSANMMHKTGTRALEETRVTTQQWAIIGALARDGVEEGIAVGDLTRFLLVSRQNLTGVLSRLEALGLVERVVSPTDSRSRLIRLTEQGRTLWRNDMRQKIANFYAAALDGFSTTDKIHVIHYFDKLLQNMKRIDPDSGS